MTSALDHMRRLWRAIGMSIAVCAFVAGQAGDVLAFSALPYFPLNVGTSWTYREGNATHVVTVAGEASINGYPAKVVQQTSPSLITIYSNDANGIQMHRQEDRSLILPNGSPSQSVITFSPPVKHANANIELGQAVVSSGTATLFIATVGEFIGSYTSSSQPIAFETVTTPLGVFYALRIDETQTIAFNVNGQAITETVVTSTWAVSGIGPVRQQSRTNSDPVEISELVATSLGGGMPDQAPDPFAFDNVGRPALNSVVTSGGAVISGMNLGATATITGGSYNINGGAFTNEPGIVSSGDTVRVKVTASATPGGTVCAVLKVGTGSGQFCAENATLLDVRSLLHILTFILED